MKVFTEDQEHSKVEARTLEQKPKLELKDLRSYTNSLEDYLVDQFPARPKLLKAKSILDQKLGKRFTRDVFIGDDNWLFTQSFRTSFNGSREMLEKVLADYKDKPVYYGIAPVKDLVFKDRYSFLRSPNSALNLKELKYNLSSIDSENFHFIDLAEGLFRLDKIEDSWYASDFHWNVLGAKAGVDVLLERMKDEGHIDNFVGEGYYSYAYLDEYFQGDLNRRFSNIYETDDRPMLVDVDGSEDFSYFFTKDEEIPVERSRVISPGLDKDLLSYNDIYTENLAYYRVVNPHALNDRKLLILKDSMQNPTSDIFSYFFKELVVVDPRMEQKYSFDELVDEADIVLFFYNSNNNSQPSIDYVLGD